jgi:hypothetical protein
MLKLLELCNGLKFFISVTLSIVKGKTIHVQNWTGAEVFRRFRVPDFKIIGP